MAYLNIIYFLILIYYQYKFLTFDGRIVKDPLDKNNLYHFTGPEMFWVLTFSTSVVALQLSVGLDLMAIRLFIIELFCIIGLRYCLYKPVWVLPLTLYSIYIAWLVIGCFYTPSPSYGIRVILKYIYPLLLCVFASAAVRYSVVFMKSSLLARIVALISFIVAIIPFIGQIIPGVFWYPTARCIHYIPIFIFSLTLFLMGENKKKNMWYTIIFALPCFFWTFRTSLVGMVVALMVYSFFRYKYRSLPVIGLVFILGVIAVFYIPAVKNKMFYNPENITIEKFQQGKISKDDINSNSRFAMWEWAMDNYYEDHELTGSGTGNLQRVFYTNKKHLWGGLKVVHNDYVQILCDNGLIGIVLLGSAYICVIIHCFSVYCRKLYPKSIRIAAITAGSSLAGIMACMYSDNVVNYSMCTLGIPLAFYGMMLGMLRQYKLFGDMDENIYFIENPETNFS